MVDYLNRTEGQMVKVVAKILTKADVSPRRGEVTIHSQDERGRSSEFTISFSDIMRIAAEVDAAKNSTGTTSLAQGYQELRFIVPDLIEVSRTEENPPNIAIVFDRGSPRQVAYRLSEEMSQGLENELQQERENLHKEPFSHRRDQ